MKNKTHSRGLTANSAILRASIKSGVDYKKASRYMEFVFSTLDISGQNSFEIFLEKIQDENSVNRLSEAAAEYYDFDGLYIFLSALLDVNVETIQINKALGSEAKKNKPCVNGLDDNEILKILEEMSCEVNSKTDSKLSQDKDFDSNRLSILGCEVRVMNLPDMQHINYINIPEQPFSVLMNDFNKAEHLEILSDIAANITESEGARIMFIVGNQQTGLIACSYIASLLNQGECGNYEYDDNDQSIDFSGKMPIIDALEITNGGQRNYINGFPLFDNGLDMQTISSKVNNIPWFEKYDCNCPLIVMLDKDFYFYEKLTNRLNELGQKFSDIFIICENWVEATEIPDSSELDLLGGKDISEIVNDISFESDYEIYQIGEPEITSEYYRKVFVDAVASEGYKIDGSVNINEVLRSLKKFRSNAWNSNLTILKLIKKAISMKPKGSVLMEQDFGFLKSSLIMGKKRENKPAVIENSAIDKMNKEIYGLDNVKKTILDTVSVLKMRAKREKMGLKQPRINNTFVFLGPPGAGKTEMAEHLTKILFENDLLAGKRFVNINAAQLKGAYVGHTAPKVTAIFESNDAIFLDEAYSLTTSQSGKGSMDTFSQEALAQLCVELERHSQDKLVIFAGYGGDVDAENNKMKEFLNANPGVASRITFTIEFSSYLPDIEMPEIFAKIVKNAEYDLEDGWRDIAIEFFRERAKSESFGNGREARRLFQNAMTVQAARLFGGMDEEADIIAMRLITRSDLKTAASKLLESERQIVGKQQYRIGFSF